LAGASRSGDIDDAGGVLVASIRASTHLERISAFAARVPAHHGFGVDRLPRQRSPGRPSLRVPIARRR